MMPQFHEWPTREERARLAVLGIAYFSMGITKKVVLADMFGEIARPLFAASLTASVTLIDSWIGVLAYTLQIYFDFSAYSDMAMGLALLFGIRLPINFNSPYQATSIIEFWRRWHMTLSRFLRDYVYIPLGGRRGTAVLTYRNLFLTMLVGGIWHGAGWTFVIWGALHGAILLVNHFARSHLAPSHPVRQFTGRPAVGWLLTMVAVIFAWVFFRAETVASALTIIEGLLGLNGIILPLNWVGRAGEALSGWGLHTGAGIYKASVLHQPLIKIILGLLIVTLLPNTHRIVRWLEASPLPGRFVGILGARPAAIVFESAFAGIVAAPLWLAISLLSRPSEFIYFQF